MKILLFVFLLLGLVPSANAADTCNFVSEYYPEVIIEIDNHKSRSGFGKESKKKSCFYKTAL